MTVPIFPADLQKKRGFVQVAKKLQKLWPNDHELTRTESYEVLAHGLGYSSFQQLHRVSMHTAPDAPAEHISSAKIRMWVSVMLHSTRTSSVQPTEEQVDKLVDALPLARLLGVKPWEAITSTESEKLSLQNDQTAHGIRAWEDRSSLESNHQQDMFDPDRPYVRFFTNQEWSAINEYIVKSGSLRDFSILMLVRHHLSAYEIANMKIADRIEVPEVPPKTRHHPKRLPRKRYLPAFVKGILTPYIQSQSLSAGDYLFSAAHPGSPITIRELDEMAASWAKSTEIEIDGVSFESLCSTTRLRAYLTTGSIWPMWGAHR